MRPKEFKLSILDRAIEIVKHSEIAYAYSCFAIEKAVKEAHEGRPGWIASHHANLYSDFADAYFSANPPDVKRDYYDDDKPFWWNSDGYHGRYIPERVEFMGIFREWLVEQGAT